MRKRISLLVIVVVFGLLLVFYFFDSNTKKSDVLDTLFPYAVSVMTDESPMAEGQDALECYRGIAKDAEAGDVRLAADRFDMNRGKTEGTIYVTCTIGDNEEKAAWSVEKQGDTWIVTAVTEE